MVLFCSSLTSDSFAHSLILSENLATFPYGFRLGRLNRLSENLLFSPETLLMSTILLSVISNSVLN